MSFTQIETFDRELTTSLTVSVVIPVHNGGESFRRCLASFISYFKAKLRAALNLTLRLETFEEWVIDRFRKRLYRVFLKTYTERVLGIPCTSALP